MKTSLTGIKPTGAPHLGTYLGAIRPAIRLAESYRTLYFIADYHALASQRDPRALVEHTYDVAAAWLACGLDPARTIFFRQSAVPQVFELSWIFSCLIATGQLEQIDSLTNPSEMGESPNAGLFTYPILMAADIALYDADEVPIGKDQKRHVEMARDLAERFNHTFRHGTLVVPEPLVTEAPLVPGTDGEKMSKSRGNVIPLFAPPQELEKAVMGIRTGAEDLEASKDPETSTVFHLYRHVASPAEARDMARKLRAGGYGWDHAKKDLAHALERELGPARDRYWTLRADEDQLDEILTQGARKAREIAAHTLKRARLAVGIDRIPESDHRATVRLKLKL